MALLLAEPDLSLRLALGPFAPRVARHAVGQIDDPSPDLRDVVGLLTSNLVTRARRACGADEPIELRAWMPRRMVRIELRCRGELFDEPAEPGALATDAVARLVAESELELLDGLADRWGAGHEGDHSLVWLEIDRVEH
jgi:hypothetical protein